MSQTKPILRPANEEGDIFFGPLEGTSPVQDKPLLTLVTSEGAEDPDADRGKGIFDQEDAGGATSEGVGATKSHDPLAKYPKTVL